MRPDTPGSSPGPDDLGETAALVTLAGLPGIGPATLWRCHRETGGVSALAALVEGQPETVPALAAILARAPAMRARGKTPVTAATLAAAARGVDPAEELARNRAVGEVLVHARVGYPWRLAEDPWAPAVLFAVGNRAALDRPTVAIVGTRNATRLGRDLATQLGHDLALAGITVISGLALGIDGAAHRGVLDAPSGGGAAVGVVASGVDVTYPRRHTALQRDVGSSGLLLSETPAGQRPTGWRFPARNRIIAALADIVVVVESRSKGGSMHTVREALTRDVSVMAVPGHPSSPSAAGTNDLLHEGAHPVRDASDVLVALGLAAGAHHGSRTRSVGPADPAHREILAAIGEVPASLAEIVVRCARPLEVTAAHLAALEVDGWVVRDGGWFERATPHQGTTPHESTTEHPPGGFPRPSKR